MRARRGRRSIDENDALYLADRIADLFPTSADPSGRKRNKVKLLLYCASELMYEDGRKVFALSAKYLAKRTGVPESTVRGFFSEMEERGVMVNLGAPGEWHKATRRAFALESPGRDAMGAETPGNAAPTGNAMGAEAMGSPAPTSDEMGAKLGHMGAKLGHMGAETPGNAASSTSNVSKGPRASSARPPEGARDEETGYSGLFPEHDPCNPFGAVGGGSHGE